MNGFVFITDTHFKNSSKVRSGDVLEDLVNKLNFVVDYCNEHDCALLHGGDVFDTPSVPDQVKTAIIPSFVRLKNGCYAVPGNHSILYNNYDYNYKTSYNVLTSTGLVTDLSSVPFIDFGNVVLTAQKPVVTVGKPQIVVYHGFLNQEDGKNTFLFSDLETTDDVFVLLGHDHCVYDDLRFKPNIKIIRPGSFLRGERSNEQERTPQLVHIILRDGKLLSKKVPIKCRDWSEIFRTKKVTITKEQQKDTYESVIAQIRDCQKSDMTFEQAIKQVADPDVSAYMLNLLKHTKMNMQFNKQNL